MCCESVVNKVLMGSKRLKNKFKIRLLISSKCHFFFLSWNQPHLLLLNSVLLKKGFFICSAYSRKYDSVLGTWAAYSLQCNI